MKTEKKISLALTTAAVSLVQGAAVKAENPHDVGDWDFGAAILFYQESDDRVQAVEPIITAKKYLDTDETLSFKLTFDALTGASPSGAVPTDSPQTFTKPSGRGIYTINNNEQPLDDTFRDTRVAFNTAWEAPLSNGLKMGLNGNISTEYDYRSFSAGTTLTYDANNKNTTYATGFSLGYDQIDPVGGVPIAFAEMAAVGTSQPKTSETEDKFLMDVLLGVTQIIDKYSLFQLNYSLTYSNGYLTDPYKVISVVDASTGNPLIADAGQGLPLVIFESRPDSRIKHAFYGQYKRWLTGGNVLDASYRFMIDDWGVNSHTLEARFRFALTEHYFIQPHLRYYQQGQADFYTPFFIDGSQPTGVVSGVEASSDYRLGEFTANTIGLEFGSDNNHNSWSVAFEYYLQSGSEPSEVFGELKTQELFPDVEAMMLRLIYDF